MSHSIRLRGPWEFSIPDTQIAGRIEFPCDWSELRTAIIMASKSSSINEKSPITLKRRFHRPTGLEAGARTSLVVGYVQPFVAAELNGANLRFVEQPDGLERADITDQLAARNELAFTLEPACPSPIHLRDAVLEVALEIQPA